MDVVVDDRDSAKAELALRDARSDRDVVEDAEAHRAIAQRVVPRRAHEREATGERGVDRSAGGERRPLVGRFARDGIAVEPCARRDRLDALDVLGRVAEQQLLVGCCAALACIGKALQERLEPRRVLRMVPGRVQARERGMRQDVDLRVSSSCSSEAPRACAMPTR